MRGDGYYNICKIFNVTQEDLDAGTVELTVETGPLEEDGYQPTNPGLTNTPEGFSQDSRDALLTILVGRNSGKLLHRDPRGL